MGQNYTNQENVQNNNANRQEPSYEYIAVLDLGSESMSAFLGKTDMSKIVQIDLQDLDNIKKWTGLTKGNKNNQVKLLLENNGNKSLRLRNKIVIKTRRGKFIKGDKSKNFHAKLKFKSNNEYKQSIFDIFQEENNYNLKYLCNPKVIYAKGTKKILPKMMDNNQQINFEPAEYLKHLTAQIVNNVILESPQIKEEKISANKTKLVITIPNVYSLTHAKELINFLRNHTDFAEVDYVYESDAVVYASLVKNYTNFSSNIKKDLERKFTKINKRVKEKEPVNIISHDIGKGTTDLSLFQIYPESNDSDKYNIHIRARTGLTKAGNALDYIFVNFFENNILMPFYKNNNIDKSEAISLIESNKQTPGFQNEINDNIQEVIYRLKKNISLKGQWFWKNYSIIKDIQKQIQKFPDNTENNSKTDAAIIQQKLKKSCEQIIDAAESIKGLKIVNDNEKDKENIKNDLTRKLYNSFINGIFKGNKIKDKQLKHNINKYVEALGNNLPDILKHNAVKISEATGEQKFSPNNENTFVIISGQASQFNPLKEKIKEKYTSLYQINDDQIIFLENTISKDICAIGGFLQQQAKDQLELKNPNDLLADYYFMNLAGIDNNSRLDYKKLNDQEIIKVTKQGKPQLFFCSIIEYESELIRSIVSIEPDDDISKTLNIEDFKSFLKGFTQNGNYNIQYDKINALIIVNNMAVELGNSPQSSETIYINTWPEILK